MSMPDRAIAIVGVLVAILAIMVTLLLRERKHLDYEFISGTRLLANEAIRIAGELQLRFRNSIVKDPYLLLVRLINTGNRPLTEEDFEQPVRIDGMLQSSQDGSPKRIPKPYFRQSDGATMSLKSQEHCSTREIG